MKKNEYVDFSYTGGIQSYTITDTGIYKLEVWGSQGGWSISGSYPAGYGGYSIGYKKLKKGTKIYIGCGGYNSSGYAAGYNGGGKGNSYDSTIEDKGVTRIVEISGACGGGATHIALVDGTLASIGKESFDKQGLIVAGGGGGNWSNYYPNESEHQYGKGYSGGGLSGEGKNPGTQTSGYAFGQGQPATGAGGWGKGAAGGGGGYYGGYSSETSSGQAGGGSGWIGGVPEFTQGSVTYTPSTENGVNSGAGKAKLTLVKKTSIKIGDTDIDAIYLGDNEIDSVYIGDTEI